MRLVLNIPLTKVPMKALVLAAGEGRRMEPLTTTIPKPLLPVGGGKSILQYIIENLHTAGLKNIVIVVGKHAGVIREFFSSTTTRSIQNLDVNLDYVLQFKRLGTAHALITARSAIHPDDRFICINGDVIINPKVISNLLETFNRAAEPKPKVLIGVVPIVDRNELQNYGIVEIDTSTTVTNHRVLKIMEKPASTTTATATAFIQQQQPPPPLVSNLDRRYYINAGLYLFTTDIFDELTKLQLSIRGEYELTAGIQNLLNKHDREQAVQAFIFDREDWLELTYTWDLLHANERLLPITIDKYNKQKKNYKGVIEPGVTIKGTVYVGENTIIKTGSYIEGTVWIDSDTQIGPNCLIRGTTYIGKHCRVGNAVEIKNSIIMDYTHIPHLSYVGDSIIADHCNLGAGTNIANLRLDERNIRVAFQNKIIDTGRRKFGAVLGSNVKTGINCTINVGTIIGANTKIGPGAIVSGTIGANTYIR